MVKFFYFVLGKRGYHVIIRFEIGNFHYLLLDFYIKYVKIIITFFAHI